jgi:hypothetical protein
VGAGGETACASPFLLKSGPSELGTSAGKFGLLDRRIWAKMGKKRIFDGGRCGVYENLNFLRSKICTPALLKRVFSGGISGGEADVFIVFQLTSLCRQAK